MKKVLVLGFLSVILFSGCIFRWPWPFDGGHGSNGGGGNSAPHKQSPKGR